ncbi:MAG: glycoside hydrolase family 36 protein [Christensenellales bacterium]
MICSQKKTIKLNDIPLHFADTPQGLMLSGIGGNPDGFTSDGHLPFTYTVCGAPHSTHSSSTGLYADGRGNIRQTGWDEKGDCVEITYEDNANGLRAKVFIRAEGRYAIRQYVEIENISKSALSVTGLSSAVIPLGAYRDSDTQIGFCRQAWQGEGQWRFYSASELGLAKLSVNGASTGFSIQSTGSYTTVNYYPNIYVISGEKTYFCELEPFGAWHIFVGLKNKYCKEPELLLECGGADERRLNFIRTLNPGERYKSSECVYGIAEGGLYGAVKSQYDARRRSRELRIKKPLVCFNDYMNCLWANPDRHNLMPLIDSAQRAGADCFIIDAGWFHRAGESWDMHLGDWNLDSDRFGSEGLKGIISEIERRGMLPGVWLELEVAGEKSNVYKMPDSWFLMRRGKRAGGGSRVFFDFSNEDVKRYLHGKISDLYALGVRFIKNDYNDSVAYCGDEEEVYNVQRNQKFFYDFIREVKAQNPGLFIENCASGALRSDGAALNVFDIQSISDQEEFELYSSIITGNSLNILPEQTGVWAMPYPVRSFERNLADMINSDGFVQKFADGETTAFNMVNGLCGRMYLSGRIDRADDLNFELIESGVSISKELWPFMSKSYPEFPLGLKRTGEKTWNAYILFDGEREHGLLYVWRLDSDSDEIRIPLGGSFDVRQIYPKIGVGFDAGISAEETSATVALNKKYSARLFKLTLKS